MGIFSDEPLGYSLSVEARAAGLAMTGTAMEDLRDSIEKIRFANVNFEHRHFIPEAALFEVVTESAVALALRSRAGIPVHEIGDLTSGILRGARKCFAILVLMDRGEAISGFFRRDSLQQSRPDDRLPYMEESLKPIFGEAAGLTIKKFLENQHEVAIPIVRREIIFRQLDDAVILPFLDEELAGRGSMGTAWKVKLHPQCHGLDGDYVSPEASSAVELDIF